VIHPQIFIPIDFCPLFHTVVAPPPFRYLTVGVAKFARRSFVMCCTSDHKNLPFC